ncbi:MAG: FAD-dependent oxidoreductase [Alphaproteobacteria bacterium]
MAGLSRIAIVGGGLAGLRAAETLREMGFTGSLSIFSAEPHPPYNRPPLSKQYLTGDLEDEALYFPINRDLHCDIHLNAPVTRIRLNPGRLWVGDAEEPEEWDGLVLATGATPIRPPIDGLHLEGVHFLKSLPDGRRLRSAFLDAKQVVVVGGGFIGCEIAASARMHGLDVTIVDLANVLMLRALGSRLGAVMAEIHRKAGVQLKMGRSVKNILGAERATGVLLDDGTELEADLIVIGVGSTPDLNYLDGSGLTTGNGIICDAFCRVEGGYGRVAAAGDVANWPHPSYGGRRMRIEHWTQAAEQGEAAARALLSPKTTQPFNPVLSLWSDQYGKKLQAIGAPWLADAVEVVDEPGEDGRFFARCWSDQRLIGVVARAMPAKIVQNRTAVIEALSDIDSAQHEPSTA